MSLLEGSITTPTFVDDRPISTNNGTNKETILEKQYPDNTKETTRHLEILDTSASRVSPKIYSKNIFIETLNSDYFTLTRSIPVNIEYDGEVYIANNYDLELYGYAETEVEAINDLRKSILEFYEDLKDENDLGIFLKRKIKYCKEIIRGI
jgi:hypothetical protein